jgi:hypothetical protein
MTTLTITCITTGAISNSGVPLMDIQTGSNAILPAGYTVTEAYAQAIGSVPLTSFRRFAVGTEFDDNQFTGGFSCGLSTNFLNTSDHAALTDIGGITPSRQYAYTSDAEFRVEAKCFGSIPNGQLKMVFKMKPMPPASNPQ